MDANPVTFHLTPDETAYLEACLVRRRELLALCEAAPDGQVLAHCETATVDLARQHAQGLLSEAIARRVASAEKKGRRPESVAVVGGGKAEVRTSGQW